MARSALLVAAAAALRAAPAHGAPRSIMQDDALLIRSTPDVRDRTLDEMAALGVDTVRVLLLWRDMAVPGRHTLSPAAFAPYRALAAAARARGMRVLVVLTGPAPVWASGCPGGSTAYRERCRPRPELFARFVSMALRALPEQHLWSLWNEPNAGTWLIPQIEHGRLVSPRLYRGLVRAATHAFARRHRASDTVLIGETAPLGHTTGRPATRPTPTEPFVRALFCGLRRHACAPLPGTAFAHHLYPSGSYPLPCLPGSAGTYSAGGLTRLRSLLHTAAARGLTRRNLRMWITEAGVQSDPPDRLAGVSLAAQARDINHMEYLAARAHAGSAAQYLLVDEARRGSFQSGLRFLDGAAKPARAAYRVPVWVVRVRGGVRVWGRARPARTAVRIAIQHRSGSGRWSTVTVVAGRSVDRVIHAREGAWRLSTPFGHSRVARAAQC